MNHRAPLVMLAAALALGGCAARPLREFTTDGCSLFPDGPAQGEACWAGVAAPSTTRRTGAAAPRKSARPRL